MLVAAFAIEHNPGVMSGGFDAVFAAFWPIPSATAPSGLWQSLKENRLLSHSISGFQLSVAGDATPRATAELPRFIRRLLVA
jgi:hypothetical protein